MKKYKLNTTRPEFLMSMMGGQVEDLTEDIMGKSWRDSNELCYCAYTAIMDANIKLSDIEFINNDGESIVIRFRSKSQAKDVLSRCNMETVRYGKRIYTMRLKLRDRSVIIEAIPDVDNEEESA